MSSSDRSKWDRKYAERSAPGEPSAFLVGLDDVLPRSGLALDVAGGAGRHALWLSRRGLTVTLVDVSEVGLAIARREADSSGLDLQTMQQDLDGGAIPPGPWDLIVSVNYLQRSLFASFATNLAPGGLLVFCQATRSNLERHPHPSARFLLDDGELPGLVAKLPLNVVSYREGWSVTGRHEAELVARRG